nr:MAG TPA: TERATOCARCINOMA-DERIVED GROWTH FACTOR/GROWTH FACTOR, GROWTH FACTOR, EGF-CFC [Caudoviricetes sp.]
MLVLSLCKCNIVCKPHGYWVFKNLLKSKEWICDVFKKVF